MKTELVTIQNGKAVTSSLQIAQVFDRQHAHVLRSIRELDCSPQFTASNFGCSFYISELRGGVQKKHPMYYLTKDGFTFLVMGFTGKLAAKFKEEYINAFNEMEQYIQKQSKAPTQSTSTVHQTTEKELKSLLAEKVKQLPTNEAALSAKLWEVMQSQQRTIENFALTVESQNKTIKSQRKLIEEAINDAKYHKKDAHLWRHYLGHYLNMQ